jgi:hypothetical protein
VAGPPRLNLAIVLADGAHGSCRCSCSCSSLSSTTALSSPSATTTYARLRCVALRAPPREGYKCPAYSVEGTCMELTMPLFCAAARFPSGGTLCSSSPSPLFWAVWPAARRYCSSGSVASPPPPPPLPFLRFPLCVIVHFCVVQAALDSNNPNGVFAGMGIPPMEYGKIITMIYLKVGLQYRRIGVSFYLPRAVSLTTLLCLGVPLGLPHALLCAYPGLRPLLFSRTLACAPPASSLSHSRAVVMADRLLLGSGAGQNPVGGRHDLPYHLHLPREVFPRSVSTSFFLALNLVHPVIPL